MTLLFLLLAADVRGFKVTTDRTVDASSLKSIVRDVFARSGAKSNDEKAIALYQYLHRTVFHAACPTERRPLTVGPLKVINAYGWSLCGSQHTVLKALFETAGWECRYVGWPGHSTVEVKYDGRWHYFDVFLKCYYWSKDRTHVVSQEEIAADPSLVLDAVKDGRAAAENLCCGDALADVVAGCKTRKVIGDSKGWGQVTWRDENYSPLLNLPAGATLQLDWKGEPDRYATAGKPPRHSCGIKDFRGDPVLGPLIEHYGPRDWSNGRLVYDAELMGKTSAVVRLPLPYPYVSATASADSAEPVTLTVSTDGGRTWAAGDLSALVRQKYDVWVKAESAAPLKSFRLEAVVEHNRAALPHLLPGKNRVTVDAESLPAGMTLGIDYAFQEATVVDPSRRTRFDGRGVTYGPTRLVTRRVTKVPFTFDIEVGGNTPPKMVSMGRAVLKEER